MTLRNFLKGVKILEVVDHNQQRNGTEIVMMRVSDDDVWYTMFGRLLAKQDAHRLNKFTVGKQYLLKGSDLTFLWKLVVKDADWFMENLPRLDKVVEYQEQYEHRINKDGTGTSSLLGLPEDYQPTPLPEDVLPAKKR